MCLIACIWSLVQACLTPASHQRHATPAHPSRGRTASSCSPSPELSDDHVFYLGIESDRTIRLAS
jgi:hypothetical protein